MRVCPHCQLPTIEAGSYCPSCGKPLPEPAKQPPQPMNETFRFPPVVAARRPSMPPTMPPSMPTVMPPTMPTVTPPQMPSPDAPKLAARAPVLDAALGATLPHQAIRDDERRGIEAGFGATLPHQAIRDDERGPAFNATLPHQAIREATPPRSAPAAAGTLAPRASTTMAPGAAPAPAAGASMKASGSALGAMSSAAGSALGLSSDAGPSAGEAGRSASVSAPYSAASHGAPGYDATGVSAALADEERTEAQVPMRAMTEDSIPIPDPRHALLGTVVDGFAIDSILGSGGCGTVYKGRQLGLDRPVALKVPTFDVVDDPILKKRFLREARAAARVKHPSVVTIYGVGEVPDGRPYLAMELLEGVSLMQVLDDGPLEVDRALALARQIALALAETHAAGVVHRDLKPSNVIWRRGRSGDDRITIVDFGIAAGQQGSADATRLTAGGKVIGTPHYMAPEQAQGEHEDIDHRTDLYALGCVLFELLTCEVPFDGTGFEVVLAHMTKQPEAPSKRLSRIPREVDELVLKLMRKRPAERPESAEEVVRLIDEVRETLRGAERTQPAMAMQATESALPATIGEPGSGGVPSAGGDRGSGGVASPRGEPGSGGVSRSPWQRPSAGETGHGSSVVGAASTMMAPAGHGAAAHSMPQLPPGLGAPTPPGSQPQLAPPGYASQPQLAPPGMGPGYPGPPGGYAPPGPPGPPGPHGAHGGGGPHSSNGPHRPTEVTRGRRARSSAADAQHRPTQALSTSALAWRRKRRLQLAALVSTVCASAVVIGLVLVQRSAPVTDPGEAPPPGPPSAKPSEPGAGPGSALGSGSGEPSTEGPKPPPTPAPVTPEDLAPRAILIDAGEHSMRMMAPKVVAAGKSLRAPLELWGEDGEPLEVKEVLITVEQPSGAAHGFEIQMSKTRGVYEVPLMLAEVGRNVVRIFPSGTNATFEIDFDVRAAKDVPPKPRGG